VTRDLPELSERERRILEALIDAHIATAEPVGSKAIAEIAELGVSSATIRNVLAALDDHGLTGQPHTSAGRVPTDLGLRYYVDSLVRMQVPSEAERGEIAQRIQEAGAVESAMREATRVLSRLAKQTTLVVAPRPESATVKLVELVRLRDDAVLFILVTAEGKVQNRLLEWRRNGDESLPPQAPPAHELFALGRRLTELLEGKTLEQGQALLHARVADARTELGALERKVMELSSAALAGDAGAAVHVDGTAHLLSAGESARERTRELLALLDEHDRLQQLLSQAVAAPGVRVFIGEENPAAQLVEQGLVAAPLGEAGRLGVLAVIGPRHLDYRRVVPLVDLTAQVVSRLLRG
jgi:heat-inducible transcriptional repressor